MKILSTALLLVSSLSLYGQGYDSLVTFNELSFASDFERDAFVSFKKGQADVFSLLIANGSLLTESQIKENHNRFLEHIKTIDASGQKKNDKRAKLVYDNIHKKYLKKFELKNRFEEVFYNGYYNSLSAAALLAMTFNELKIPYVIKEEPSQVYVIAYPLNEKIVLRSAADLAGHLEVNDDFKKSYIDKLKEQKLIEPDEYASHSMRELFDKYYFDQHADIDLVRIAGLQYINDAFYLTAEKKFDLAFAQAEKAYLLNPSTRTAYLTMVMGAQAFESHKAKDSVHAVILGKLSRYSAFGIEPDVIIGEFAQSTQALQTESGARNKYVRYYSILSRSVTNVKLKDDLAYVYNYESGRYYYNLGRFPEAMPFFETALRAKPTDMDVQGLFLVTLTQTLRMKSNEEIIAKLESYNIPALAENDNFNSLLANTYLEQFMNSYGMSKATEGEKYRVQFEKIFDKHPNMAINPNAIGMAYSTAAVHYYRKSQVAKAKQLIASGLKYAPHSYELKQRQQMIR